MDFEYLLSDAPMKNLNHDQIRYVDFVTTAMRLDRISRRQVESTSMFNRLKAIMDQIEDNIKPRNCTEVVTKQPDFLADHNYAFSNSSSGASSSSSTITASSSAQSAIEQRFSRTTSLSAKRKIIDDEYQEFSAEDEVSTQSRHSQQNGPEEQYPQTVGDVVILGPNGTEIDSRSYTSIIWSSSASATRQLLGFVFSSDVLATHTLTGKPSPAFYGRERPAKMQLDPIKAADIIHCVKSKFQCTEREIRAAITTKCSDTSKKYKRRSQKQMESSNKM